MEIKHPFDFPITAEGIVQEFRKESNKFHKEWVKRMAQSCLAFGDLERSAQKLGQEIGAWLTVRVMTSPTVKDAIQAESKAIRKETRSRYRNCYRRDRDVKLLGGTVIKMHALYCGPRHASKRPGPKREAGRRGPEGGGLYPEFAALGIHEGASPALQDEVGWMGCQLSSMEKASEGLKRHGVHLSSGAMYNVLITLAQMALSARHAHFLQWRKGQVPIGDTLAGKRVGVAIDGGRVRLRRRKKGKRAKKRKCQDVYLRKESARTFI